jgi:hypothetical protein
VYDAEIGSPHSILFFRSFKKGELLTVYGNISNENYAVVLPVYTTTLAIRDEKDPN